mgnify:CR=1 FL=1
MTWEEGVTDIATINYQLSTQMIFIFMIGLYGTEQFDCHPWSLAFSSLLTFSYTMAFYFGYVSDDNNTLPINPGVTGIAIQLILLAIMEALRRAFFPQRRRLNTRHMDEFSSRKELVFPHRPSWDIPRRSRFGERTLTPQLLWKMMDGVHEPLANPWYVILMVFSISLVTPWVSPGIPQELTNVVSTTVNGIPWWAVKIMALCVFPSVFICISLYHMPRNFPSYDLSPKTTADRLNSGDSDIDKIELVELTPEEMGHRTAYDQRNELVYKRRRQILENLGLSPTEIDTLVRSAQEQLQSFDPSYHFNHNETSCEQEYSDDPLTA